MGGWAAQLPGEQHSGRRARRAKTATRKGTDRFHEQGRGQPGWVTVAMHSLQVMPSTWDSTQIGREAKGLSREMAHLNRTLCLFC